MNSTATDSGLLAGLRVLEVSETIAGAYAGKLFTDVGADVVLAEPVGGHRLREDAISAAALTRRCSPFSPWAKLPPPVTGSSSPMRRTS